MGKKYYAVRKGKVTGILATWDECRDSVHGYPGAEYKSFAARADAEAYLNIGGGSPALDGSGDGGPAEERCGGRRRMKTDAEETTRCDAEAAGTKTGRRAGKATVQNDVRRSTEDELIAYVDGSYHAGTKEFSYGVVLLLADEELCFAEKMADRELAQMHNVAGEIKGSEAAMRYALENGYRRVVIYHDYEGIAKWCLGLWKTNKEGTKAYKAFYDGIKDRLDVKFVKVAGHSNDKYNDMADELAKGALGIGC